MAGTGVLVWLGDGETYIGNFSAPWIGCHLTDQYHGFGHHYTPNGGTYIGGFFYGMRNGFGKPH